MDSPTNNAGLSEAGRQITGMVVRRFMDRDEATSETDLMKDLKPFRPVISESLRRLANLGVLSVVNNTYTQETYAPRAIAFHHCGGDVETFAKRSTELILQVVHNIVERQFDNGRFDETKQYTRDDALAEARTIDPTVTEQMVRVGMALAYEFNAFQGLQPNAQQIGVLTFRPSRQIFQIGPSPWDEYIRRLTAPAERIWAENHTKQSEHDYAPFSAMGLEAYIAQPENQRIFLVHGHAEEPKKNVSAFLRAIGLEVIILHEQPNKGQTIIEKLEHHSNVAFAVVLLTPDDDVASAQNRNRRARQNVTLELGYFLAKLGRQRVCCVYVDGVELPSDYHGVLYVLYDGNGKWRAALAKELIAAGIEIDTEKLAAANQKDDDAPLSRYVREVTGGKGRMRGKLSDMA